MLSLSKLARLAVLTVALTALTVPGRAADLDRLAPGDAEGALVANIKSLIDSKLYKTFVEAQVNELLKKEEVAAVLKMTGIDPLKDLSRVIVTGTGFDTKEPTVCVIVKGNFNVAKIQATIEEHAKGQVKVSKEGGLTYYSGGLPGQEVTGTFIGNDTVVISNKADYLKKIATGKMIDATANSKVLKGATGKIGGQETTFVALAITDEMKKKMADVSIPIGEKQTINPFKTLAPKLDAVTGAITVGDAVDVVLSVHAADEETAKALGQVGSFVVPLLLAQGKNNPQLKPITDALGKTLKVGADGKMFNIKFQLTEDLIKKLQPGG
jgi:hypothetical protein